MVFTFKNHTRYAIYQLWRDALTTRRAEANALVQSFQVVTEDERYARRRFVDGLVKLANTEAHDLIEGGALSNAVSDLVVLARAGERIPQATVTQAVRGTERTLEQVVLSEPHEKRYVFVPDLPPVDDEYELLGAAHELDGELFQDETFSVQELVALTRMDIGRVRRVLCLWLDDAVAYVPRADHDPDADREPIVLLEKAKRRSESWDRYRIARENMMRFILTVRVSPPFPPDPISLIRSIALGSSVRVTDILRDPDGFKVQGYYPDDWSKEQIAGFAQKLEADVLAGFANVLSQHGGIAKSSNKEPAVVLYLAANPIKRKKLALDEEARDIEQKILASEHRDRLKLKTRWAVRPDDLLQALNEDRPSVVHFTGHGDGVLGIMLQGDDGKPRHVDADALRHVFAATRDRVKLVVLSACYSIEQSDAICDVIDCVVVMNNDVGEVAARKFAASFYRALGFGHSVKKAFDQGIASLKLEGLGDHDVPELHTRPEIDPDTVFIVERS